ncbi:tRNA (adenosine(37)-N6)-threonylcarbamoyltransferase complex transferase subunit TsaD [Georgenia sp. Z1491]|uniref:tRNA (adenosine(37)-N6)-threonylcarbamoyltransferase complex transferase subunit TsaD n=1 Tax=Georgenia sp. Z1491 TaxID=3416707 RepID=UPI003CE75E81
MTSPLVLGIETSCDETGIALVRGTELVADVTASSMEEHARFGGIIPEIASRAHLEAFGPTLGAALARADVDLSEVDAIAVTAGPGLVGSLTVGAAAAKALALSVGRPILGVNHVIGHAAVDALVHGAVPARSVALVVSGGHTTLLSVGTGITDVTLLGETLDDAAGEAFDKVGRLLGLPYPGGPHVDRLAATGDREAIRYPRGLSAPKDRERHAYNFSFSGLKTAVARDLEARTSRGEEIPAADVAAGFSEAVADVLATKALRACADQGADVLVVGGGFSANSRLRELLAERGPAAGVEVRIPPPRFCTDNGAMIAALGSAVVEAGLPSSSLGFGVDSSMAATSVLV